MRGDDEKEKKRRLKGDEKEMKKRWTENEEEMNRRWNRNVEGENDEEIKRKREVDLKGLIKF